MKKILVLVCAAAMMVACTTSKQSINSKDLEGKYEIDFSSVLKENTQDEEALAAALTLIMLSQMQMTMQFDGGKLIIDATGAARNLINAFGGDDTHMPVIMDYQIKQDSVLYTRSGSDEFQPVAVLRKVGDSYDYLQLVKDGDAVLTMRRLKE